MPTMGTLQRQQQINEVNVHCRACGTLHSESDCRVDLQSGLEVHYLHQKLGQVPSPNTDNGEPT